MSGRIASFQIFETFFEVAKKKVKPVDQGEAKVFLGNFSKDLDFLSKEGRPKRINLSKPSLVSTFSTEVPFKVAKCQVS